jgi:ferredoxin-NADP reductase
MSDKSTTYTIIGKHAESSVITSFLLIPDNGRVPTFHPGEYLLFELPCGPGGTTVRKEYSISGLVDGALRVTIKRELSANGHPPGVGSAYFHDRLAPGDKVRAAGPFGQFRLDRDSDRPLVLLSGGVGLTPLVAMARELAKGSRQVTFIHACEDGAVHAMGDEIRALARTNAAIRTHFCYRLPRDDDRQGRDYDSKGFLTPSILQGLLPLADCEFYLCGPGPFMQAVYDMLMGLGVRDQAIRYESFGPATLRRSAKKNRHPDAVGAEVPASVGPFMVHFAKSGLMVAWDPTARNLLEFAEEQGLMPDHSCRAGSCESCKTRIISGKTEYLFQPYDPPSDGSVLICCSVPKGAVTLDL